MDRDELEARARHVTELDAEYERAPSSRFGPISKQRAEELDAVMAEIQHPESAK
jgi:hypothetical protein